MLTRPVDIDIILLNDTMFGNGDALYLYLKSGGVLSILPFKDGLFDVVCCSHALYVRLSHTKSGKSKLFICQQAKRSRFES